MKLPSLEKIIAAASKLNAHARKPAAGKARKTKTTKRKSPPALPRGFTITRDEAGVHTLSQDGVKLERFWTAGEARRTAVQMAKFMARFNEEQKSKTTARKSPKRIKAAQKAARTRKANKAKRSAAGKKAARTRKLKYRRRG